jgi:hypothetical protein
MNTPLILHLVGAAISGLLVVGALVSVFSKQSRWYKPTAIGIAVSAALQLISGSVLSFVSNGSLLTFCARIGIYLSVLVVAELVVWSAARKNQQVFPTRAVVSSFATGLAAVAVYVSLSFF